MINLNSFFSKLGISIFYIDLLDTKPEYALRMLKELWTNG